jgi:hypothetical protein
MTITAAQQHTVHHPAAVSTTVGVLIFLGLSAVGGGVMLLFTSIPGDNFPSDWLERLPLIDSWLVPGLVLGIGFGLGSLIAAYGMLRKPHWGWLGAVERLSGHHWAWLATIALGVGQVVWIALEVIYLGFGALHAVYGTVGLALVLLPLLPSVRSYL